MFESLFTIITVIMAVLGLGRIALLYKLGRAKCMTPGSKIGIMFQGVFSIMPFVNIVTVPKYIIQDTYLFVNLFKNRLPKEVFSVPEECNEKVERRDIEIFRNTNIILNYSYIVRGGFHTVQHTLTRIKLSLLLFKDDDKLINKLFPGGLILLKDEAITHPSLSINDVSVMLVNINRNEIIAKLKELEEELETYIDEINEKKSNVVTHMTELDSVYDEFIKGRLLDVDVSSRGFYG